MIPSFDIATLASVTPLGWVLVLGVAAVLLVAVFVLHHLLGERVNPLLWALAFVCGAYSNAAGGFLTASVVCGVLAGVGLHKGIRDWSKFDGAVSDAVGHEAGPTHAGTPCVGP